MAFTQQNEKDGYLFFAIAFNAVPGKTYAAQVVAAYESGMTTQQIVNEFTTKPAFLASYPNTLSHSDFAQAFVSNVTAKADVPAAAKTQAIADITAALDAGLSIGDVIFNVITNISSKTVADAEWGTLVQLLNNKVAVAEALTEGQFALDTTDAGALQAPLAKVDTTLQSVQDAIAQGGALKGLLALSEAAVKAQTEYSAGLGLTFADTDAPLGTYKAGDAVTKVADVTDLVGARADAAAQKAFGTSFATYNSKTATEKTQAIASVKTSASNDLALKKDALTTANSNVAKVNTLAKKGADLAAADAALLSAQKAQVIAAGEVTSQTNAYNVGKDDADKVSKGAGSEFFIGADTNVPGTKVIELVNGKYAFVTGTAAAVQTALKSVLDAANASVAADKALADATTAQQTADTAVTQLDTAANEAVPGATAKSLLAAVTKAKTDVSTAEKNVADLDKAVADLSTYGAEITKLGDLSKAVSDASTKLDEAGYSKVTLDGTVGGIDLDTGTGIKAKALLIVSDATNGATTITHFKADDHIVVGSGYTVNTTGDVTKGNNSVLEVFAKTNAAGTATDVYIEQKAFGSSVADAANGKLGDIVKITLTGVTADKLAFADGMITLAA